MGAGASIFRKLWSGKSNQDQIVTMFCRTVVRSGAVVPTLLRTSKPCIAAAPPMLFHTSVERPGYKLPDHPGKVRLGFIPDEWFQMFYSKTGVTGPYVFGTGLLLYMINKELYVLGPETVHGVAVFGLTIYAIKKFGHLWTDYVDGLREEQLKTAEEWKANAIKGFLEGIEEEKKELWRLEGRHHLFDAKRENVALQLETEFRERQLAVTNAVKSRLDYHVAIENMKTNMEQQHMVKWIEKNVIKSITPAQEKELLNKCISDLKSMSVA